MSEKSTKDKLDLSLNYLLLRKLIGTVGIVLPLGCVLIVEGKLLDSISHYYYSDAGVLFTGTLLILAAFLICNVGYKRDGEKISDWTINIIAGICIAIVAVVPTSYQEKLEPTPIINKEGSWQTYLHFGAAVSFFLLMSLMFLFKFTLTKRGEDGKRVKAEGAKKTENFWYRLTGGIMLLVLAVAGIVIFTSIPEPRTFVFWIEVSLLIPFSIGWFVKGRAQKDVVDGAKMIQSMFTKKK